MLYFKSKFKNFKFNLKLMSSMIYLMLDYPNPRIASNPSQTDKEGYCCVDLHEVIQMLFCLVYQD